MTVIERIHQDHRDLARVLKKHAGIRRVVEDLYPNTAHFIYELLQNAEDTGATEAAFVLTADKLVFEHDGRAFNEADIRAITDIGEGTKTEDNEQIGRFGIGFKAVFAYTETPRIWSPSYSFKISEMVLPSEIPSVSNLRKRTRFEFPFNSRKMHQAQAFSEVKAGLEEISDNTLLFLSNIEMIHWRIDGVREGRLLRIQHSDHHIGILRENDDRPTESTNFLRFTEPVDGFECQHAAVAFELEPILRDDPSIGSTPLEEQFRISPSKRGCVAVYFTAAKETSNLRFHLHAPFVPDLSRSSIKDTPANLPLFKQLAGIAAKSLSSIRDLGLLDREFLAVLPNSQDEVSTQYADIRDAIVDAMNKRALTPTHAGGHEPAGRLLQAEAGLKSLLDHDDINFLFDTTNHRRDWAITARQRNSREDRFLSDLDIKRWGVEQFVKELDKRLSNKSRFCFSTTSWKQGPDGPFLGWICRKPAEWHRALYALFYRELENKLNLFKQICIVRCSDGEYRIGSHTYFPTPETREDTIHPRVAEETYTGGGTKTEQKRARAFLDGVGVCEVGEYEQIEAILKRRYAAPASVPPWQTHQSDLRRFIALVEDKPSTSSLFKDYFIIEGSNHLWSRPGGLYLDEPYLKTGLKAYYEPLASGANRTALSDAYSDFDMLPQLIEFAQSCGVADRLAIAEVSCRDNPEKKELLSAPGSVLTETGIDTDFAIPELEALFETPNPALSHLVWQTLCVRSDDKRILKATYQKNKSNYPRYADSQLVHQLRNAAWVPQQDATFVRPAEASSDLLPKVFPFDPGWAWITKIYFGEETETLIQGFADALGFGDDELAVFRRFVDLAPDIRKGLLEGVSQVDLPVNKPNNPDRRARSVRKNARQAPERKTEQRKRLVSVNRDRIKREKATPYLRELYTNADGVTFCQACKDSLQGDSKVLRFLIAM